MHDAGICSEIDTRYHFDYRIHAAKWFCQNETNMNLENLRDFDTLWESINQHAIVSMTDLAGNITFANDTFSRICGYSREELIGKNHRILKSDVQSAEFWETMWKTISSGHVWRGVVCNLAKDSTRYWVQTQISPFFDANGAIEKYVSIRTDISAHKRALDELEVAKSLKVATEALELRKLYLRATLDNLPFQFWLKDAQGRYLAVNQVLADACGFNTVDELIGLTDVDIWPAALALKYQTIDAQVMQSRQEQTREETNDAGGQRLWFEVFIKPLFANNGEVTGTVGFTRDISARKLAQAQLQERTEQLDTIFDLSPDGFVSFDTTRRVNYLNPAFTRMSGITSTQAEGLDEQAFSSLLGRHCSNACQFQGFDSLRRSNENDDADKRTQIELTLGGKRILEVALRSGNTSALSQVLYFRDVTNESEVERLKGEFLNTAAHELRTPMVSVYGFLELLTTQQLDEVTRQEYLGVAFRHSELMVSILNELLDLASIERRRGSDFVFEPMHVQALVSQAVHGFKAQQVRAAPCLVLPDKPLYILADKHKARQAIENVLSNAYKYSTATGLVQISLRESPDRVEAAPMIGICIADQGIGMTPEQQSQVFERFYRADTSGKILGTGLGMCIVHEIVTLHGGSVELTSAPGVGTTVTLWLPELSDRRDTVITNNR